MKAASDKLVVPSPPLCPLFSFGKKLQRRRMVPEKGKKKNRKKYVTS